MEAKEKIEDLDVSEAELNDLPVPEEQAVNTSGGSLSLNYTKVSFNNTGYDSQHKP